MKFLKNYRFPLILLFSICLGTVLGIFLKSDAAILKPFGDLYLNMMFTIVVPLVFFTISSSIANMFDLKRLGKILKTMFIVFFLTSLVAALFMLVAVLVVNPVGNVSIKIPDGESLEKISFLDQIVKALTVNDFKDILSRSNMLPLIIFSIIFGVAISSCKGEGKVLANALDIASKVMMKIVKIIMYYAPIGLCAYFAALIGEFGPSLITGYVRSFVIYVVVSILYYFIFYTLYAYIAGGKVGIKRFYAHIFSPTVTALATQSSLASMPTNLETTKEMGILKDIREVTIPIGSTMNMHGSVMGSILKIAFLFTVFQRPFTGFGTLITAILIAVLSGVVMSGIPGGGLIGEMLIVSLYNFPASAFAMIATIGIIIDAPATAMNVVGNPAGTMLITRFIEGKNWWKAKKDE